MHKVCGVYMVQWFVVGLCCAFGFAVGPSRGHPWNAPFDRPTLPRPPPTPLRPFKQRKPPRPPRMPAVPAAFIICQRSLSQL